MKTIKIIIGIIVILFMNFANDAVAQRPLAEWVRCYQGYQDQNSQTHIQLDASSSANADIDVFAPQDPNEIIGTVGYDAPGDTLQWVSLTASLPYTIYFENDPNFATAAAQKVEIRLPLHAKADIATFAVGTFGFGSHIFAVEGNFATYQQRLDLTEDMGLYVDVVAGIDVVTNEAFWIFESIDPATGLPPQGTQQGFLPINDESHNGEGFVTFTIRPKGSSCVTGDVVTATASIIFDVNEPLPTNVWHNTVDALPPTTQMTGSDNGLINELLLQFTGEDDEGGCGLKQFKLYVSDNYAPYQYYDTYLAGTEAVFPTEYNHCYRFYCLGEDNAGNVEEMKAVPDFEYGNYNLVVSVVVSPEEGGTVTGAGTYVYDSQATLTAIPAEEYAFRRWILNGVTVSEDYVYTFAIHEDLELVAEFEPASVVNVQHELAQGWNWWSTYINMSGGGLEQLENALGDNGVLIKSQHNGFVMNDEGDWYGSLQSLDNRSMYRIMTETGMALSLSGTRVNPSQINIEMSSGWNWIGYPVQMTQTVSEALSGLDAEDGDLLKSQTNFSIYDGEDGWFGALLNMNPGQGYMYLGTQPHSFQYHSGRTLFGNYPEQQLHWETDVHAYPDNMSLVATVFVDDVEQRTDHLEVGAYSNGMAVGGSRLLYNAKRDRWFALIPVSGTDSEEVSFRLYDDESKTEYLGVADEKVNFAPDAVMGSLDQPVALHFRTITGMEEDASAMLQLYPNPVSRGGEVRLALPDDAGKVRVEIYNVLDVLVSMKETTGNTISLNSTVVPGTYILRVFTESGKVYYGKLIVK